MNDTPPEVERLYNAMLMAKSNEERFLMAIDMFDTARALVLGSLPADASKDEIRRALLKRFYGLRLEDLELAQVT